MSKFSSFLKSVVTFKVNACICFTVLMIITIVISFFTEQKSIEITHLFTILISSVIASILQSIAFDPNIFKNVKYVYRNIILIVPLFAIISVSAFAFKWFDTTKLLYWVVFVGIFILMYVGFSIGFAIYYKIIGEKYTEQLKAYKENK